MFVSKTKDERIENSSFLIFLVCERRSLPLSVTSSHWRNMRLWIHSEEKTSARQRERGRVREDSKKEREVSERGREKEREMPAWGMDVLRPLHRVDHQQHQREQQRQRHAAKARAFPTSQLSERINPKKGLTNERTNVGGQKRRVPPLVPIYISSHRTFFSLSCTFVSPFLWLISDLYGYAARHRHNFLLFPIIFLFRHCLWPLWIRKRRRRRRRRCCLTV